MFEVITGLIQFGKVIGSEIKSGAERFTSTGELVDKRKARQTAIIGSFFDPLQAFKTRASYEGGWTDLTGKKYVEHLETQEKARLAFIKEQEANRKKTIQLIAMVIGGIILLAIAYYYTTEEN